jgi:hypothetical protein
MVDSVVVSRIRFLQRERSGRFGEERSSVVLVTAVGRPVVVNVDAVQFQTLQNRVVLGRTILLCRDHSEVLL